jgi:hypothetical protein
MSFLDVCLVRSRGSSGEPVLRFGVKLLDDYLDFVASTPDGVTRRSGVLPAVRWVEVDRLVPLSRGVPVARTDHADAFELQVARPKQAGLRRWLGTDFTIKLLLVEISRDDLLPLLQERMRLAGDVE